MFEIFYHVVAAIGFFLLIIFATIGFIFVAKALTFAGEMALLEWKYNKVRNTVNNDVAAAGFDKLSKSDESKK